MSRTRRSSPRVQSLVASVGVWLSAESGLTACTATDWGTVEPDAAPGASAPSTINAQPDAATRDAAPLADAAETSSPTNGTPDASDASTDSADPASSTAADAAASPRDAESEPEANFDFDVQAVLASELVDAGSATVGIVTWSTMPEAATVTVEFGLTTSYGMQAPASPSGQRAVLLGMKPERTYHYRLVASANGERWVSDDFTLTTGGMPASFAPGTFTVLDASAHARGFIVGSFWAGAGSTFVFIADAEGEIVWAYDTQLLGGVGRARISADGQSVWCVTASNAGGNLVRISIDTTERQVYPDTIGSHDIAAVTDDVMAYIDYGEPDCNSIVEIDAAGNRTEIWDSEDELAGLTPKCHGNALNYWASEDTYSFSDLSHDVFMVDRSGSLLWRLAHRVSGAPDSWGGRVHGQHLLESSLLMFANLGGPNVSSAVIEYSLSGAELWRYEGEYSTGNFGDVQRLPGGNTLITYSNDHILQEVTRDKQVVMEWNAPASFGYSTFVESLYPVRSD